MEPYYKYLNTLADTNHHEYSSFKGINWCNSATARQLETERGRIISDFSEKVKWAFKGTKPWINRLSKGCVLCGEGDWSCLFISGICNANCFYCPAPQVTDDHPVAQRLEFIDPERYAEYLNFFGYRGCSFSGGEPFLKYERLKEFLKVVRKRCSPDLYTWVYTNGILVTEDKLKEMADLGIDEIRFDIGANGYRLDNLKKARGVIKNITVEIPSVPAKTNLIKQLIPRMEEYGVSNLNLHRLRLTKHNAASLIQQKYTVNHGEHPTVGESEISALKIISFVERSGFDIGVNYCSFQYKNRFQKAGHLKKITGKFFDNTALTETGYSLKIWESNRFEHEFHDDHRVNPRHILTNKSTKQLSINDLRSGLNCTDGVIIELTGCDISMHEGKGHKGDILRIKDSEYIMEKGKPVNPVLLTKEEIDTFLHMIDHPDEVPVDEKIFILWHSIYIEPGLREFY